jgi:hypothetical protein
MSVNSIGRIAPLAMSCMLLFSACGSRERLTPFYKPNALVFEDSYAIVIPTEVPMTVIHPNFLKRMTGSLFGWIPVLGSLISLPIDLVNSLIPSLEDVSHPELSKDARLSDPEVIARLSRIRIHQGELRIVPENQRGPDYSPSICWFKHCEEIGFSFLDEIRIYLVFESPKRKGVYPETIPVLIGRATKADYDQNRQRLPFSMTNTNIRNHFARYNNYRVQVVANGRLPIRDVYITGNFMVEATIRLR